MWSIICIMLNPSFISKAGYDSTNCEINDIPWAGLRGNEQNTGCSQINTSKNNGQLIWSAKTGEILSSGIVISKNNTLFFCSKESTLISLLNGTIMWRFNTTHDTPSTPAIGNNEMIYFGSRDSYLYSVTSEGVLEWKYKTGGAINHSPLVGNNGTIYFGSDDHLFYALNPDGTLKWTFRTNGEMK